MTAKRIMAIKAKGMARARKPSLIGHRRSSSLSRRRVSTEIGRRAMFKNEKIGDDGDLEKEN